MTEPVTNTARSSASRGEDGAPGSHHGRGRAFARHALSIVAGFGAAVILSYSTDAVLRLLGFMGDSLPRYGSVPVVATVLAYRTAYNVLGCYITLRLALPRHPFRYAMALGALGFAGSFVGAVASPAFGPGWYTWGLVIMAFPSAWASWKWFASRDAPH